MLKVFSIRKRICQPGGRLFSNPINVSFLLSESFFIRILANAGGTFGKPNWLKNVQREIGKSLKKISCTFRKNPINPKKILQMS